jgi:hypothetical protein
MPFSDLPLTSGQTVAEGERYIVRLTPAGTFRIAHRTMPEKGVNFMWLEKSFSASPTTSTNSATVARYLMWRMAERCVVRAIRRRR